MPSSSDLPPWLVRVKFRYNQKLVEEVKQIPGGRWEPDTKSWIVPIEMVERVKDWGRCHGVAVVTCGQEKAAVVPASTRNVQGKGLLPESLL
jgi:hypothetical protein